MSIICSPEWAEKMLKRDDVVAVDCRFKLGDPNYGYEAYVEGHLPGAVHMDLEREMSGVVAKNMGRHPLPSPRKFASTISEKGIGLHDSVIAYDDQLSPMACRFAWMMKWLGHVEVYVIDGGLNAWLLDGYSVESGVVNRKQAMYTPSTKDDLLVDVEDVKGRQETPLIDSRAYERYIGKEEPIDPVAGHIPGAICMDWKNVLDERGRWKSKEALQSQFRSLHNEREVIVYCGSGVTATVNIIALWEAGVKQVKLYSGSFSHWITDFERPVERC
ncbi:sulfurtransferase [Pontibacillus halophilus]|uniref:sulfurtransferase n=1 Tax=Pontibacillus halophilus TaxID=516704 RepID=UPI00040B3805|nr:sulfurtransferase [Pontibacillus halophilus]